MFGGGHFHADQRSDDGLADLLQTRRLSRFRRRNDVGTRLRQDEDVQAAIELMEAQQIRRLPVVDDEGKVVGILAPSDLAPTFASTNVADFLLAVS
jgi:CBS-domain-containing membrane protein